MRLLLIVALTTAMGAGPPEGSGQARRARTTRPTKNAAAAALRQVVERAEFREMPFEDFVEWVERTSSINVVVRWKALEQSGVTPDTPVTLRLRGVKLSKVLTEALRAISPESQALGYQAVDNVVTISTRAELNQKLFTVVYDVQDLLVMAPQFEGMGLNTSDIGRGGGRGVGSGPLLRPSGSAGRDPLAGASQQVRDLVAVITSNVEPDTWQVNGGRGTISFFNGKLVVRNNAEVHQILRGGVLAK